MQTQTHASTDTDTEQPDAERDGVEYHWRAHSGAKSIAKKSGWTRRYYHCADRDNCGCAATKTVVTDSAGKSTEKIKGQHNHEPNRRPKLSAETKSKVKDMFAAGAKPAAIERHFAAAAQTTSGPASAAQMPTAQQIRNMKFYQQQKQLPGLDALTNICALHGSRFVVDVRVFPHVFIVMIPELLIPMLTSAEFAFVDGTFRFCEGKLQLTIILIEHLGLSIGAAYMLSSSREQEVYAEFFSVVQDHCNRNMQLQHLFCDFEAAIRNASRQRWPSVLVHGDPFHLLQACLIKAKQLGADEQQQRQLMLCLRVLWGSPTPADFESNVKWFELHFATTLPAFAAYFRSQWLDSVKPVLWARFGLGPIAQKAATTSLMEAHNQRLRETLIGSKPLSLNAIVDALWREYLATQTVLTNEHLLKAKQQQRASSAAQSSKSVRLVDFFKAQLQPPSTDMPAAFAPSPLTQAILGAVEAEAKQRQGACSSVGAVGADPVRQIEGKKKTADSAAASTESAGDSAPPTPAAPQSAQASSPAHAYPSVALEMFSAAPVTAKSKRGQKCASCKLVNSNKDCKQQLCQSCCAASDKFCSLTSHKAARLQSQGSDIISKLQKAMDEGRTVFIKYNGGSQPGRERAIQPLAWGKEKDLAAAKPKPKTAKAQTAEKQYFSAYCVESEKNKTYNTACVASVQDEASPAPPANF